MAADPSRDCTRCAACCVAPDISSLGKGLGVRCTHLGDDLRCRVYAERPAVCRSYPPDELCDRIAAPTLEGRVAKYLAIFGLAP